MELKIWGLEEERNRAEGKVAGDSQVKRERRKQGGPGSCFVIKRALKLESGDPGSWPSPPSHLLRDINQLLNLSESHCPHLDNGILIEDGMNY